MTPLSDQEQRITPKQLDAAVKEAEAVGLTYLRSGPWSEQAFRALISAVLHAALDPRDPVE